MPGSTVTDPSSAAPDIPPATPYLETRRPPGTRRRKWRARLIVLLMVAAVVLIFVKLTADRATESALIDLGTVTLTAQAIPVETPRPGQITQVSVRAEQRVEAGAKLGVVEVTMTDSDGEPVLRKLTLVVPRVTDANQAGAAPGFLRVVLLPTSAGKVSDLVPGMRFTGTVDTRTGPANPRLVAMR